ncbi:hypothetical protein [Sangeribacter muris]|uniref:hypothetical protein n=1 Tax=Sangeribacter muris TaxID=2880703 RepID=UPI00244DF07B|nr:hypothetical protein [Sangeribacter muris]
MSAKIQLSFGVRQYAIADGCTTIATVEISLKDYSIVQCRAFANKVCEYTEQIAGIIKANKKMIAERKRA